MRLPAKLEERAAKYRIPPGAFRAQFAFDRCAVWQIADDDAEDERFKGTLIFKADATKRRDQMTAPRGVLVSAGALALDHFRTHGIEIGDIVWFVRLSPWRRVVDVIDGKEQAVMVLRSADVIASEDLAIRLDFGSMRFEWDEKAGEHALVTSKDERFARRDPDVSEDY